MKLQFWGVRGYVPTPGAEYLRYGGNTCCLALHGNGNELVVLDSGTGFCQLGDELMRGEFSQGRGKMVLLITHSYWDHILGMPFPGIVHRPGNHLTVYGPDSTLGSLEIVYDGVLSPVYSPVYGLAHIGATHHFQPISTVPFTVGNLKVRAMPLSQRKHSPIWAYRVEEGDRSLVYITDVRYIDDNIWKRAVEFSQNASVLVHSAPYTRGEPVQDYGHSRVEDAMELAAEANVERLLLYHHAPNRTDDQLDALVAYFRDQVTTNGWSFQLDAACEGPTSQV
jgi:phosphoribosyl 1,2-cyclic phosphodiesterase